MKILTTLLASFLLLAFSGTVIAEVEIVETPLAWDQVARLDGDVVFNNLCAACHGVNGKGDGPAATALEKGVPDLTVLAASNRGAFPIKHVEKVIAGKYRVVAHETIEMPVWGEQFYYIRGGSSLLRESYVKERIHALSGHIERLQVE
jgi:mono/diheme cytochrome c family protein